MASQPPSTRFHAHVPSLALSASPIQPKFSPAEEKRPWTSEFSDEDVMRASVPPEASSQSDLLSLQLCSVVMMKKPRGGGDGGGGDGGGNGGGDGGGGEGGGDGGGEGGRLSTTSGSSYISLSR